MEPTVQPNGTPQTLIEMTITFDPQTHATGLRFDPQKIRNWDFVLGLLEMGKLHALDKKREAYMAFMQQQQLQAAQEQQLLQELQSRKVIQA